MLSEKVRVVNVREMLQPHLIHEEFISPQLNSHKMRVGLVRLKNGQNVGAHSTGEKCEEVLFIIDGCGTLIVKEKMHSLKAGDCVHIPPQTKHDVTNSASEDLIYMYIVC